jgi:asparagine synthase (glutamine-hydrolysing)
VSAILGVFGPPGARPSAGIAGRMLARMARRGSGALDVHRAPGALLAVARHRWETAPHLGGPAEVASRGAVHVAADATLYHRADLRRALAARGVPAAGSTAAELVLAAYRAWGPACAEHLEGDFAFVLWDGDARRAVCARDFAGKRPLAYAPLSAGLVVASTPAGVLGHPGCPDALDPVTLAETAAGMWAGGDGTAFRAVRELHAGHTLVAEDGEIRIHRHWTPPRMGSAPAPAFDEAAEELRGLLVRATAERMPPDAPAVVWMSGGWDSTAVLAAGEVARARGQAPHGLEIVSVSHPPGDEGREDEIIRRVADHWNRPVHWLRIGEIPLLDGAAARAAERDEPFAHVFEAWNRALIDRGRALGARVALDGNGGDQLFFVSNVYLADLLRAGRWRTLWREWKAKGGADPRDLFETAVQPLLPHAAVDALGWMRGRPLRPTMERLLPSWIAPAFARKHALRARERLLNPRLPRAGPAAREAYWYLTAPYFPRAYGLVSAFALEMGVEVRSPLLDRRVVEFAAGRPREERNAGRETKRLLRAAMRGLLPADVLAPRDVKTGTLGGYFSAGMRAAFPALAAEAFRAPRLADLGIVEPAALRAACAEYARTADGSLGFGLLQTLQVEWWLRARENGPRASTSRAAPALATAD